MLDLNIDEDASRGCAGTDKESPWCRKSCPKIRRVALCCVESIVCANRCNVGSLFGVVPDDNVQCLDYLSLFPQRLRHRAGDEQVVRPVRYRGVPCALE